MSNRIECICGCGQFIFEDGADIVVKIPLRWKDGVSVSLADYCKALEGMGERYLERRITRKTKKTGKI